MPAEKPRALLEQYAGISTGNREARQEAQARLQREYGNDPLRILYRGAAAVQMVMVTEASGEERVPDKNQVRADFAAWLVLNKEQLGKDTQADWRVVQRCASVPDKTYLHMLQEAGYSVLPPQAGPPSALMRVCESGSLDDVIACINRLPSDTTARADILNYQAGNGYTAVHAATINPASGIISQLNLNGAELTTINRGRRAAHMAVLAGNTAATAELLLLAPETFFHSPACLQTPYELGMNRVLNHQADVPRPVEPPRGSAAARQPGLKEEVKEEVQARAKKLVGVMECTNLAAAALGLAPPFSDHTDVIDKVRRSFGKKGAHIFRNHGPN